MLVKICDPSKGGIGIKLKTASAILIYINLIQIRHLGMSHLQIILVFQK